MISHARVKGRGEQRTKVRLKPTIKGRQEEITYYYNMIIGYVIGVMVMREAEEKGQVIRSLC